jgi:hypothetical protein
MDDTQLTYHAIKALGEDDTPVSGFVRAEGFILLFSL